MNFGKYREALQADWLLEYGHHHTATEHGAGTHGNETADPLTSGAMKFNKNDMVGRTGDSTGRDNTSTSTTAGPHSSNLANKADPRVDSDLGMYRVDWPFLSLLFLKKLGKC